MNIIIFGPPGAGKGTQSEKIIEKYGLVHISTGDLFRWHTKNDTELGKKVKEIMNSGQLVPDSITIDMLKEEVDDEGDLGHTEQPGCQGEQGPHGVTPSRISVTSAYGTLSDPSRRSGVSLEGTAPVTRPVTSGRASTGWFPE